MLNLGNVQSGSTLPLYFPFVTSNKTGSVEGFAANLAVTDFKIFKNGSTSRGNTTGYSIINSGSLSTGSYMFGVDISDNTVAGFYDVGQFHVLLSPGTANLLDGQQVENWIGKFNIIGDPAQTRISGSILATSSSVSLVYTDTTAILADTTVIGSPAGASIAADIAQIDTVVDGIQTDLSNGTDGLGAIKTSVDGIQTDLDNTTDGLGALKTSITIAAESASFASQSAASADVKLGTPVGASVSVDIASVQTDTTAILEDTGTTLPNTLGTPTSSIAGDIAATSASIVVIDSTVDAILVDTGTTLPNTLGTPVGASLSADISVTAASSSFASQSAASADVKLGTPAGASVSADIATIDTVVDGIQTDLDNGTDGLGAIKAETALILADTTVIGTPVGASLSSDISVVAASSSFASQSAASADVKLGTPAGASVSADIATIDTVVDGIQTDLSNGTDGLGAIKGAVDTVLTTALTEAYGTDGSALTAAQLLYMVYGLLGEFSVSGTTVTVKQLDGSSTAATFTLFPDGTSPTSMSRTG